MTDLTMSLQQDKGKEYGTLMNGLMAAGMFMAFQSLMGSFQAPVNNLLGLGATLQTTEMQIQRLDDAHRFGRIGIARRNFRI